jgi:DNA-binding NtrC family response regulator
MNSDSTHQNGGGPNHRNGHASELAELDSEFLKILELHDWNLSKSLDYCERALMKCALEHTRGNQSQTARLMGITARSVYNKIHKHKLTH